MRSELGWPETAEERDIAAGLVAGLTAAGDDPEGARAGRHVDPRRSALGWPVPPREAVGVATDEANGVDVAPDVSRETPEPDARASGPVVVGEDAASGAAAAVESTPPPRLDVSRETPRPHVATAASIAAEGGHDDDFADTPIARETQAMLRSREAVRAGNWPQPASPRVLVVANQKGGVGKTTTTVNLAAALALNDLRVLVVDLDPQGNASTALGVEHRAGVTSVYDAIIGSTPLAEMTQPAADVPGLTCIPATIDLAGAEIELVPMVARESRLKRALAPVVAAADVDYILIDCPPSLGLLTVNALVASYEVLIPIQCEYYALEGLGQLLHNIELVRSHLNQDLDVSTILLTMYDGRTRLSSQVADEVREHFGDRVLSTVVPRSVRISEAPSYGQTVMTYDPGSSGALSYLEAAREMAGRARTATDASPTGAKA